MHALTHPPIDAWVRECEQGGVDADFQAPFRGGLRTPRDFSEAKRGGVPGPGGPRPNPWRQGDLELFWENLGFLPDFRERASSPAEDLFVGGVTLARNTYPGRPGLIR